MLYTVLLTNTGSYAVSGAAFVDTMPANTTYVGGSATATSGSVFSFADPTLSVTGISVHRRGRNATIAFKVRVNGSLPAGLTQIRQPGRGQLGLQFRAQPTTPVWRPTAMRPPPAAAHSHHHRQR